MMQDAPNQRWCHRTQWADSTMYSRGSSWDTAPFPVWSESHKSWPAQLLALCQQRLENRPRIIHLEVLQEVQPQLYGVCSQFTGFLDFLECCLHCSCCNAARRHLPFVGVQGQQGVRRCAMHGRSFYVCSMHPRRCLHRSGSAQLNLVQMRVDGELPEG